MDYLLSGKGDLRPVSSNINQLLLLSIVSLPPLYQQNWLKQCGVLDGGIAILRVGVLKSAQSFYQCVQPVPCHR